MVRSNTQAESDTQKGERVAQGEIEQSRAMIHISNFREHSSKMNGRTK